MEHGGQMAFTIGKLKIQQELNGEKMVMEKLPDRLAVEEHHLTLPALPTLR